MNAKQSWDAELYEARHSFVWQFGQGLVELLAAQPGERILDLGCGTGQLTNKIAEAGAVVTGLDASPDMIGQARQNYPALRFVLADAASMQFQEPFDAVFSNAAIHWMPDHAAVARRIAAALRPGGRLVAELGGKGNIREIEGAIRAVLPSYCREGLPATRTRFPSVSEFSVILEQQGVEVRLAQLFDRPTLLEGAAGMKTWLEQFAAYYFEGMAKDQREAALGEIVRQLEAPLFRDGKWWADYRRLRVLAFRL